MAQISITGWLDKWTRKITEELLRNRQGGDPQNNPETAFIKFLNPERTKGQLPNGKIVDIVLKGSCYGQYAIGIKINEGKYLAYREPVSATRIDDTEKAFVLYRTDSTGEAFFVAKIGSTTAYAIPPARLSFTSRPTFAGFSSDGKIVYFIWWNPTLALGYTTRIENWTLEGNEESGFTVEGDYFQESLIAPIIPNFNISNRTKAVGCTLTAVDNGQYLVDICHLWSPPVGGPITATLSITRAWDITSALGPPTTPQNLDYLVWQPGVPYNTFTVAANTALRFFRPPSDTSVLTPDLAFYMAESTSLHPAFLSRCFWIKRITTLVVDQRFNAVPNISGAPDVRIPTNLHLIDSGNITDLGLAQDRLGSSFQQATNCVKAINSTNSPSITSTFQSFKIDPITGTNNPNPPVPVAESYTTAITNISASNAGVVGVFNFRVGRRKSGSSPPIEESLNNDIGVDFNLVDWVIKE